MKGVFWCTSSFYKNDFMYCSVILLNPWDHSLLLNYCFYFEYRANTKISLTELHLITTRPRLANYIPLGDWLIILIDWPITCFFLSLGHYFPACDWSTIFTCDWLLCSYLLYEWLLFDQSNSRWQIMQGQRDPVISFTVALGPNVRCILGLLNVFATPTVPHRSAQYMSVEPMDRHMDLSVNSNCLLADSRNEYKSPIAVHAEVWY